VVEGAYSNIEYLSKSPAPFYSESIVEAKGPFYQEIIVGI